jgi:putative flippase GtrA
MNPSDRLLTWEPFRYLLISGMALLADMLVFSLSLRWLGVAWPVAACLGFVTGVWVAYGLSIRYVFQVRKLRHSPRVELLIFVGLGVLGLGVTQLVLYFCIEWLSWPAEVSKGVAAIVTFLTNFISRKVLLFK